MQVVWVAEALKARCYLNASYWFVPYVVYFAIVYLAGFRLNKKNDPTTQDAHSAAKKGYGLLVEMAKSSVAAERCVKRLEVSICRASESLETLADYLSATFQRLYSSNQTNATIYGCF